jgi:hypothetical protein
MRIAADSRALMDAHGIHSAAEHFIEDGWRGQGGIVHAFDAMPALAFDAQPGLITTASGAIPAFLGNIMDPQVVKILTAPVRAAEIFGETKKGDWTTTSIEFPFVEPTGQVTSYGDYNNGGNAGVNVNWMPRQSYHFQTIVQWGERELARYGLAGIDYVSQVQAAAAWVTAKFLNKSYFFGVNGLVNYGSINDPNLISPITPTTKTAGGTTWAVATAQEVFNDINQLFGQLVLQMGGWVIDANTKMKLVLPTVLVAYLNKVSTFNVSAMQTIKGTFPNMSIETAPEYATAGGNLIQLVIEDFEGVKTSFTAFTEKARSHAVVVDLSSWRQKKSAGTWGWINRRSICIAQGLGY